MEWIWRLAEAVKARRSRSRGAGRFLALVLVIWKGLRNVPFVNRLRLPVRVDGHTLWVRCFSYDDLLMASPDYESSLQGVLPPKDGVAVDVGACIGRHALAYARAAGPHGRVIAVEPQPDNYRLLERNVSSNGYSQVQCVAAALGAHNGEAWLRFDRETSTGSLVRDLPLRRKVRVMTLDRLLESVGVTAVDLVKIDAEGAELDVLEGSQGILSQSPKARVLVELHSRPRRQDTRGCAVANWLTERGYAITELADGKRRFYLAVGGPRKADSGVRARFPDVPVQ